jgi:hypothetical protein
VIAIHQLGAIVSSVSHLTIVTSTEDEMRQIGCEMSENPNCLNYYCDISCIKYSNLMYKAISFNLSRVPYKFSMQPIMRY